MDKELLRSLAERYFNAETTLQEERELLQLALRLEGIDSLADEVLAVMGYSCCRQASERNPIRNRGAGRRFIKISCAAVFLVLVSVAAVFMGIQGDSYRQGECYAYIDGKRIVDRDEIASLIDLQLSELGCADEDVSDAVASDLNDMGDAFNFDNI